MNASVLFRSWVPLLGLGLVGCAVGPDYRTKEPAAPSQV
jgi:hypothetical protein